MRTRALRVQLGWAAAVVVLLFVTYRIGSQAIAVQTTSPPDLGPRLEHQEQTLYAVLGPVGAWADVDIMLNNNSPTEMRVVPTVYVRGQGENGEPITLQPAETRWIPVRELLPDSSRRPAILDALELHYFGYLLDLRTQVVAKRPRGHGSVDVLFTGAGEFRSQTLAGVWVAPPGGRAVVTLGNTTDDPIAARLEEEGRSRTLLIRPHDTVTVVRPSVLLRPGSDSMIISSDGPTGALRAGGYIEYGARTFGIVRFYDPGVARRPRLFGSSVRVRNTDVQMALLNTSSMPISVQPEILPATREGGTPQLLPPVVVAPHQSALIDTRSLGRLNVDRASIRVQYSGQPGSLVGYLAAIDRTTLTTYELPFRDPGPMRQSTGNYPWRLDGDYSSIASIANVGSTTGAFSAVITYAGGVYRVKPEVVPPGATATFDIREIRDRQIPGLDGSPLPLDAEKGQFKWSVIGPVGDARLNGRMEIVSRRTGQSSSYSCGQCCPDSYDHGVLQPSSVWTPEGWSTQFTVITQMRTCSGSEGYQSYAWANSWDIVDPFVTSVDTTGWGSATANGLNGGQTFIEGQWNAYVYQPNQEDCYEVMVPASGGGSVEVQTPTSLRVTADYYTNHEFNNFNRHLRYNVLDQNGRNIFKAGMHATETLSPWSPNGCNFPASTLGEGDTDGGGGFSDDLGLVNQPGCTANPFCTSSAVQTIRVDGRVVRTNNIVMACSGITIDPQ